MLATRRSTNSFTTLGLCVVLGSPLLFSGCLDPSVGDEVSEAQDSLEDQPFALWLELETSSELPEGAEVLIVEFFSVDTYLDGEWVELTAPTTQVVVERNQSKALARFVLTADYSRAESFRISGNFSVKASDSFLRLNPTPDVEITLRDQRLQPGAVNHVRVDLSDSFSPLDSHGGVFEEALVAELEVDYTSFASGRASPETRTSLTLSNGFELEIPVGALDEPQMIYVEYVTGDDPYYLTGPDDAQFSLPVTVKYPPSDSSDEPAISWGGMIIEGVYDDVGRVVVQNDQLRCMDDPHNDKNRTVLNEGMTLYEGTLCDVSYTVLTVDLEHPSVLLKPLLAEQLGEGSVLEECKDKPIFKTTYVKDLLESARDVVPGYLAIAALNGDNAKMAEENMEDARRPQKICLRDLTIVDEEIIHEKSWHPEGIEEWNRYAIEFQNDDQSGVDLEVTQGDPFYLEHAFTTNLRTVYHGKDDNEGYGQAIHNKGSRASYGFSEDRRYLIMASANMNLGGLELDLWRNLIRQERVPTGADEPLVIGELYRVDEGLTPEFWYYQNGALTEGLGSMFQPRGTNLAVGVFWQLEDN